MSKESTSADNMVPDMASAQWEALAQQLQQHVQHYFEHMQRLAAEWAPHTCAQLNTLGSATEAQLAWMSSWLSHPDKLVEMQWSWWQQQMALWQYSVKRLLGEDAEPVIKPEDNDRRFADPDWQQNITFDFIKQSYLLNARFIQSLVDSASYDNALHKQQAHFYTRQFVNALAPSNFAASNPEVMRRILATGGENLLSGLQRLNEDMERSRDTLFVTMSDLNAFTPGKNLATTAGAVVFENHLFQLIQYTAQTEQVLAQPLLIVPPWINKFYILDLREKNSWVNWLVKQGHTVFMMSWVNPDRELSDVRFDDYLADGLLTAIDQIRQRCQNAKINAVGYCIGGTLLACGAAWLARKRHHYLASATFLTTLLDFSDPGEIGVFINEASVQALEKQLDYSKVFDGRLMAAGFSLLRENDLFWSYFIANYLKGEPPQAFDLLYWNADATNLPGAMHRYYLRHFYLQNELITADKVQLCGVPIDLRKISVPCYFLSAENDHIAKWTATYLGAKALTAPVTFVLGGAGHIAGVVNPPANHKYGFWLQDELPETAAQWRQGAQAHEGSWWPHWQRWVSSAQSQIAARALPADAIEPAPGRYVLKRIVG